MGTHPANLIPPLTTKHASALSVDGTPSLARCRDRIYLKTNCENKDISIEFIIFILQFAIRTSKASRPRRT